MYQRIAIFVCILSFLPRAAAQPRECPTGTIASGETVTAALETADCRVSDLVSGSTNASLAKRYKLDAGEKAVFTFTAAATGYAPTLAVYTAQARLVGSNSAPSGGTARITINLPAGAYTIITYGAAPGGAFELKAAHELPRPCPTQTLPESGTFEGAFSASTCRFVDVNEFSTSTLNVAFFRYQMTRRAVLTLESDTAIARFSTVLLTPAATPFSSGKQLVVSLAAGTQTVSLASTETGSFTVRTKVEDLRECLQTPVTIGAEVTGQLALGGCRWLDQFVPSADPTPVKLYRFSVASRTVVQIDETSPTVDAFLELLASPSQQRLASNDDASDATTDSRLLIHLVPGAYVIVASAYDSTTLGSFTLKLAGEAPRSCDAQNLASGAPVDGQVPAEGCRVLDYISLSTVTDLAAPFRFDATESTMLALKAEGAVTSTLRAVTAQGREVARLTSNRNGDIPLELRIPDGRLTVLMSSTAAIKPAVKLGAQTHAVPSCPANAFAVNSEVENVVTTVDCKFSEQVVYSTFTGPAQPFQLRITQRGRLTLEVESDSFTPALAVLGAGNELIGIFLLPAPGKVTVTNNLVEPGDITLLVTSASPATLGAFKLRNTLVPAALPAAPSSSVPAWQLLE